MRFEYSSMSSISYASLVIQVMDIILECVEKESSLHKRVDLFFLVDSITQCSRTQKGILVAVVL